MCVSFWVRTEVNSLNQAELLFWWLPSFSFASDFSGIVGKLWAWSEDEPRRDVSIGGGLTVFFQISGEQEAQVVEGLLPGGERVRCFYFLLLLFCLEQSF